MIRLLFFTFNILFSLSCFSQDENQENLSKKIETAKKDFRNKGLKNMDKIEGIYHFKIVIEGKDYEPEFNGMESVFNKRTTTYRYAIIERNEDNSNRFDLWEYDESQGGEFFKKRTYWSIRKENNKYFVSCSECVSKYSNYFDGEVTFSENEISFDEVSNEKKGKGTYTFYYSTVQKLFPNTTEENIYKTGTGFFISKDGYIITNYHVIENSTNIYVSNQTYNRLNAQVIFSDKFNDIAILKINVSLKTIPYNIVSTNKEIGINVFTLGYPYIQSMGKEVKLTNGIINSNSGYENDIRYYQFSAEIQPGNSGGPLFDSDGNIVGLVSAKHSKATNAGYALKSKFLIDFIKINNPTLLKKNINTLKNLNLSSKYKLLKNYILLLEIE